MTEENITEVKLEIKRFSKRLEALEKRIKEDSMALYGCKEIGAVRRGALYLKNELTKLT